MDAMPLLGLKFFECTHMPCIQRTPFESDSTRVTSLHRGTTQVHSDDPTSFHYFFRPFEFLMPPQHGFCGRINKCTHQA